MFFLVSRKYAKVDDLSISRVSAEEIKKLMTQNTCL